MANSGRNGRRQGAARRRNRRPGSARLRVMQLDARELGVKKRRRLNTPLYSKQSLPPPPPRADYVCPLCSERINNLAEALEYADGEGPSHFGCVIRKLEKNHLIDTERRRLVYRGQGVFMLMERMRSRQKGREGKDKASDSSFAGCLLIPCETHRKRPTWREGLTNRLMERVLKV